MYIKKFEDYFKLNELFVHKNKRIKSLNGKNFILYKKDLWIFDEEEWVKKKIYSSLNQAYGKNITTVDLHDSLTTIKEEHLDILYGRIDDNVIYIENEFRHSEHSEDLFKLKTELGLNIKLRYSHGNYMDKESELDINIEKKKLQDRKFFHGTSLNFLPEILKKGLIPTKHTNYKQIIHEDKIFFTLNIEKSLYHAFHSAQINKSFPIIIELKVPDINKLIVDYDLAKKVYGDYSDITNKHGYDEFDTKFKEEGIDYKKDITNKIGVYGYIGRIPVSFIQDIWIDLTTYRNLQNYFNPELGEGVFDETIWDDFEDVQYWDEVDKNQILRIIEDIQSEYEEEFLDEENE